MNVGYSRIKDKLSGSRWRVSVLSSGVSKTGDLWPARVLQEATPLFDNCNVHAYSIRGLLDHTSNDVAEKFPGGLFMNCIGYLKDPVFTKVDEDSGYIEADLHIKEKEIQKKLSDLWDERVKNPSVMPGLSVDVSTISSPTKGGRINSVVRKILAVRSTDVVSKPASNAFFLRKVASEHGDTESKEKITSGMFLTLLSYLNQSLIGNQYNGINEIATALAGEIESYRFESYEGRLFRNVLSAAAKALRSGEYDDAAEIIDFAMFQANHEEDENMKIETVEQLKQEYPDLLKKALDEVLELKVTEIRVVQSQNDELTKSVSKMNEVVGENEKLKTNIADVTSKFDSFKLEVAVDRLVQSDSCLSECDKVANGSIRNRLLQSAQSDWDKIVNEYRAIATLKTKEVVKETVEDVEKRTVQGLGKEKAAPVVEEDTTAQLKAFLEMPAFRSAVKN
jgi:hypothetical protein